MLWIKLKFHAINKISEHIDLMKYENFFSFQRDVNVNTIFEFYYLRYLIL